MKKQITEHIFDELMTWLEVEGPHDKVHLLQLRLHFFFMCTVGTTPENDDYLMDVIFPEWGVQPYGYFDVEMMQWFKDDEYEFFAGDSKIFSRKKPFVNQLSPEEKKFIKRKLILYKSTNPKISKYSSFDLVDVSHGWYTYQQAMYDAKKEGKHQSVVKSEDIKKETRLYYTNRAEFSLYLNHLLR